MGLKEPLLPEPCAPELSSAAIAQELGAASRPPPFNPDLDVERATVEHVVVPAALPRNARTDARYRPVCLFFLSIRRLYSRG